MTLLRGLVTAVRTLTIVRVPGRDANLLAAALPWFPVVGLVVGLGVTGAGYLFRRCTGALWPEGGAFAMLVVGVIVTGALHLDGLADWADGLGAGKDRARALALMKDPRKGTFGVIALVLALLAKFLLYGELLRQGQALWVAAACVLARLVQVQLAVAHPYARAEGTAAAFVQQATKRHLALALLAAAAGVVGTCGFAWRPASAVGGALVLGLVWGRWCCRRLGGVTGDTIGAGSELTELFVLCVAVWR